MKRKFKLRLSVGTQVGFWIFLAPAAMLGVFWLDAPFWAQATCAFYFGALGSLVLTRRVVKPLEDLADLAQQLEGGHRAQRASEPPNDDELRDLARAFNAMAVANEAAFERLEEQNRALSEVNRLKDEFLSTVSHELRTPLTSIRGAVGVIADGVAGDVTAKQKKFLEIARNNTDRLTRLINDLLDLSKMEAGKMTFQMTPVSVSGLLKEAGTTFSVAAGERALALDVDLPEEPLTVLADRDKVMQVLSNLLSNAIKFTDRGGVLLWARREGERILIGVTDSGPGVPDAEREKIFSKFHQIDGSSTRKKGGTGLGLPICKHIIEGHGGEIRVEPASRRPEGGGPGSTFVFSMQVAAPAEVPPSAVPALDGTPTVLVVDDDPDIRAILRTNLEAAGYAVYEAGSGEEALRLARGLKPDLATVDLMLPDIDGFGVIEKLKQDPATAQIPVVVVSALERDAEAARFQLADYFVKPVRPEDIVSRIESLLAPLPSGARSILVVDDEQDVRTTVSAALESAGWKTRAAGSGPIALEMATSERPDMILLDLHMPGMDGFEVITKLRSQDATREVPVMIFSAITGQEAKAKALKLGATGYLTKELNNRALVKHLDTFLAKR
jgi:signal transduction histidine kinase/DNA-binding response OmpR family regulator